MKQLEVRKQYLQRLRGWRNKPDLDLSIRFLEDMFKQHVERPHKQLSSILPVWESLVPENLVKHTRLDSFARGVLRVSVDSSPRLFELDRLLRSGLQRQLMIHHRGTLIRRVQLKQDATLAS